MTELRSDKEYFAAIPIPSTTIKKPYARQYSDLTTRLFFLSYLQVSWWYHEEQA
jgi:hypothetical protein